jgi:transposase-like protein
MKQVSRKYTDEFKQEAVNLALKSPSITRTAQELRIPLSNGCKITLQSDR